MQWWRLRETQIFVDAQRVLFAKTLKTTKYISSLLYAVVAELVDALA